MIRSTVTEAAETLAETPDTPETTDLIPVSHLALELPAPAGGWSAWLAERVPVVVDSIGRRAVSAADARRLISEHAQREERQRAERSRRLAERRLLPRRRTRGIPVPADMPDVDAHTVQQMADIEAKRAKKDSHLDEMFTGVSHYHPIRDRDAS